MGRLRLAVWLGGWQEWAVILLAILVLGLSVGSVERAQWITPNPRLLDVLALAVLTGWVFGRARIRSRVAHPLAAVIGTAVTIWQAVSLLPSPEFASGGNRFVAALQFWWQTISTAAPGESTLPFAIFLIFLTWVMGYASIWFILKKQNAWVAIVLGTIVLVTNLSNLLEEHSGLFFIYAVASLFLLGVTGLTNHRSWFRERTISYPVRSTVYFSVVLLSLSLMAVSAVRLVPEVRVKQLENFISSATLWRRDIEKYLSDFLDSVPAKQPFLRSDDKATLLFGDSSFDRGDQLEFVLEYNQPLYLKTRMYDVYSSSGWASSDAAERLLRQGPNSIDAGEISKLRKITYSVIPKVRTDMLLAGGEFVSADIPVSVQSLGQSAFNIDLDAAGADNYLPSDLAPLARSFREVRSADVGASLELMAQLLPPGTTLTDFTVSQGGSINGEGTSGTAPGNVRLSSVQIARMEPVNRDTVAVTSLNLLRADRRYRVTASASEASPEELSGAGDDYPDWVTAVYVRLPSEFPGRVKRLSEMVTGEAKTSYEKAVAIIQYLSLAAYEAEPSPPPEGTDGVDYFLFTEKSGNCVQFASAMTVMLRSVGIPSRVVVGYAPGQWDEALGGYVLRAKERHAWPEVYFPGYGWIGFEATPDGNSEIGSALTADSGPAGLQAWLGWETEEEMEQWLEVLRWVRGLDPQERQEWLELMGWREEELVDWLGWLEQQEQLQRDSAAGQSSNVGTELAISQEGLDSTRLFGIIGILLAFTLVVILRLRRSAPVSASEIYRKMCFLASLAGVRPAPEQTPLEYRARLVSALPLQAEAFDVIVQAYVETCYSSRKELARWDRWRLQQSWRKVRRRLIRRLFHI